MPPTIGAAMRRITSEPVPLLHMTGSKPDHAADDGHHHRAHAVDGAFHDGLIQIVDGDFLARRLALPRDGSPGLVEKTSITTPVSAATPARPIKPTATAMLRL